MLQQWFPNLTPGELDSLAVGIVLLFMGGLWAVIGLARAREVMKRIGK